MSVGIVSDLLKHVTDRNTANIRGALELLDGPEDIVGLSLAITLQTLRQCTTAVTTFIPQLEKKPEAARIAIVSAVLCIALDKKGYEAMAKLSAREFNDIAALLSCTLQPMEEEVRRAR